MRSCLFIVLFYILLIVCIFYFFFNLFLFYFLIFLCVGGEGEDMGLTLIGRVEWRERQWTHGGTWTAGKPHTQTGFLPNVSTGEEGENRTA